MNVKCLTWRLISHGRTPFSANATIRSRVSVGNGRPLINSPPNWFIDDEQNRFLSKTQQVFLHENFIVSYVVSHWSKYDFHSVEVCHQLEIKKNILWTKFALVILIQFDVVSSSSSWLLFWSVEWLSVIIVSAITNEELLISVCHNLKINRCIRFLLLYLVMMIQ